VPELAPDDVLVEVAGCGVCHTDLGYFYDGVPTVSKPPLTLGHEISGTVVAGDESWVGKEVIIPAVMPCRKIKNRGDVPLSHFAVVADAATTPYQAAKRADLQPGDNVVVIGITGGVGQYMGQTAKALGAKTVVGIARNQEKLDRALNFGADFCINSTDKDAKEVSKEFRGYCKGNGLPNTGWKIFEVTGVKPGQEMALTLLGFTGKLIVVGFGLGKTEYAIGRLMAFDADIIGTWGCLPEYYPIVLDMVLSGKINIEEFVETRPMSTIADTFAEAHKTPPMKRIVLTPDF
jgi:6-hydroxycyclohex-1-ene-1-carbonyl-CoA dehydrogenase